MSEFLSSSEPLASFPAPAVPERVTLHQLQEKALDLFKNPVVMAGGALVVGLAMARISGASKLRQAAFKITTDLVKGKAIASLLSPLLGGSEPPPPAVPSVEEPVAAPVPPPVSSPRPAGGVDLIQAGKSLLQSLAPHLGELAKKKLAQVFPNQP